MGLLIGYGRAQAHYRVIMYIGSSSSENSIWRTHRSRPYSPSPTTGTLPEASSCTKPRVSPSSAPADRSAPPGFCFPSTSASGTSRPHRRRLFRSSPPPLSSHGRFGGEEAQFWRRRRRRFGASADHGGAGDRWTWW